MNDFRQPMQPYPGLEQYSRSIHLPGLDLDLFYYEAGTSANPPLLLAHGLGDEADTWRHLIGPLSRRWHVIAPDLPGFGRSAKPNAAYRATFMQRSMMELLDVLSLERPALGGHSLGANLVHRIALAYPDRCRSLILMSGGLLLKPTSLNLGLLFFMVPGLGEWLYTRLRKDPQVAYNTLKI